MQKILNALALKIHLKFWVEIQMEHLNFERMLQIILLLHGKGGNPVDRAII